MKSDIKIKIWFLEQGIQAKDVADEYGCSISMISHFLKGRIKSRGLAGHFIKRGCPKAWFKDGRVIQEVDDK